MIQVRKYLFVLICAIFPACSPSQQMGWENEWKMVAEDGSLEATIAYLPQGEDCEQGVYRLGITLLKELKESPAFYAEKVGYTRYYYGTFEIQGSIHNYVYAFADAHTGGVFSFMSCDYVLRYFEEGMADELELSMKVIAGPDFSPLIEWLQ